MTVYSENYYLRLPVDSGRLSTLMSHIDLQSDDTVCEIGCAAGHFLTALAQRVKYGIGIDTAGAAIEAASRLKEEKGLSNLDFELISAEDYAASSDRAGSFDYVFLMDVTEHLDDGTLISVLAAARRLLAEDGQLLIHTPNLDYWLEQAKDKNVLPQLEGHIGVRNSTQYRSFLSQAGFTVQTLKRLPHYRQPMRFIDTLLMNSPMIGEYFVSRLFIAARIVHELPSD